MKNLLDTEDGDTIDIDFDDLYGLCEPDLPYTLPNDSLDPDFLHNSWSNNLIEDSLETIRNVLATSNLPANNRDLIEKSLTTLKNAIDLPQSATDSSEDVDTNEVSDDAPDLMDLDNWAAENGVNSEATVFDNPRSYDEVTADAAEHEDNVMEALGLPTHHQVSVKIQLSLKSQIRNDNYRLRSSRVTPACLCLSTRRVSVKTGAEGRVWVCG